MNAGDVLTAKGFHPRIVCSFPDPTDGRVLLVSLTDVANETDHSCRFTADEHSAITKDFVVKYRLAQFLDDAESEFAAKVGAIQKRPALSAIQFRRVLHGFEASRATKPAILEALRAAGLLPLDPPLAPK